MRPACLSEIDLGAGQHREGVQSLLARQIHLVAGISLQRERAVEERRDVAKFNVGLLGPGSQRDFLVLERGVPAVVEPRDGTDDGRAAEDLDGTRYRQPQGIVLIERKLRAILDDFEAKPIDTVGKLFDPAFHEAVMTEASELPEGTILEEYTKGYILAGQVVRAASVKVSSGSGKQGPQ